MGCTDNNTSAGGCDFGGAGPKFAQSDLLQLLPFELSTAATSYGTKADVCYLLGLAQQVDYSGNAGPNTCLPAGAGGSAPGDTLIYSPQVTQISTPLGAVTIAGPDGTLLPSVAVVGSGASAQHLAGSLV